MKTQQNTFFLITLIFDLYVVLKGVFDKYIFFRSLDFGKKLSGEYLRNFQSQ